MQTKGIQQSLIRVAMIVMFSIVVGSCNDAIARKSVRSLQQELGIEERLEAEKRLWELGYWAGPADGKFDSASRHALVAFQKVERRPRRGSLTKEELNALRNASRPFPRHGRYAHVEIDLGRQVLFLIDETGAVMRILPVSTGNGQLYMDHGQVHRARTPTGTFKVLRKINGWRLSSLGLLYYPSYILNGIAVHGSFSIPTHPASHGCIRIPMFAAKELSALMPVGMEVVVYQQEQSTLSELAAIQTDWYWRIPAIRLADAHAKGSGSTFMYEFAWRSPQFDGRLGACHALEIPFVFDTLGNATELLWGANPPQQLADTMHAAWVAFATNGDCGWPKYDLKRRATMRFDTTSAVVSDPRSAERALWQGFR